MNELACDFFDHDPAVPPMGLIVLQTDETIEPELRQAFADLSNPLYVTRIASGSDVTPEMLAGMKSDLAASADLLPKTRPYPVIGYGCTSASSIIGSEEVEKMVKETAQTALVTNPLRATVAQAKARGVSKFALVSPYIESVSEALRTAFGKEGISTDSFGSFGVMQDENVVRIDDASIYEAAVKLGSDPEVEAVFLSCTNLRTFGVIPKIEAELGKPVMSSNQSMAWHMRAQLPQT